MREGSRQLTWSGDVLLISSTSFPLSAKSTTVIGLQSQFLYFLAIFAGLFRHKLTEKNTLWVFGPVFKKFERENLENITLNSSNFDFIVSKSQIFVELCTASGNTEKTFQQTYQVGNRTFWLAKLRKYQKNMVFVEKTSNLAY